MRTVIALVIGALPFAVGMATPVEAQSFLQSLFGGGQSSSSSYPGNGAVVVPQRPLQPWARDASRYSRRSTGADNWDDTEGSTVDKSKYRTLCVRTCDGYYFPVSNAVTRSRFTRDAAQCRSSCGETGRLYYMPATGDDVSASLDLAGRSYARLPAAFKYRNALVNGCACKPEPWSEAELRRHRLYAANAETAGGVGAPGSSKVAALSPGEAQQPDQTAVAPEQKSVPTERPQPIGLEDEGTGFEPSAVEPPRTAPEKSGSSSGAVRTTPKRRHVVVRAPQPSAGYSGLGGFLPQGGQYTWPGDAPRR